MRTTFSRARKITPVWNGNKELPENEQIAFEYTALEYGEWNQTSELMRRAIQRNIKLAEAAASDPNSIDMESDDGKQLIEVFKNLLPKNVKSVGAPLLAAVGDDKPVTMMEIATLQPFVTLAIELLATLMVVSAPSELDAKN